MIKLNLLPPAEKEFLRLGQIQRWVIFYGSAFLCSLTVLLILLSTAWLTISWQRQGLGSTLNIKSNSAQGQELKAHQNQVAELNAHLVQIDRFEKQHRYYSEILIHLAELIPTGIRLNEITIDDKNFLIIAGYAPKRDDLLQLKDSLEKSDFFTGLSSPLSNLIRPSDINFSFTLTIKAERLLKP